MLFNENTMTKAVINISQSEGFKNAEKGDCSLGKTTLDFIKDEYIICQMQQEFLDSGFEPAQSRNYAESKFMDMPKEEQVATTNEFLDMLETYSLEQGKDFDYQDFMVNTKETMDLTENQSTIEPEM